MVRYPVSPMRPQVIQGCFLGNRPRMPVQHQVAQQARRPIPTSAVQLSASFLHFSSRNTGQRLPEAVQRRMETFFGAELSDVRIHVGPEASSIGALAFTCGSDIYFSHGQYSPESPHGQRLLGHELAHVLQQRAGRVKNPFGSGLAVVQDPAMEAEAERMGVRAGMIPVQPRMPAKPQSVQTDRHQNKPGTPLCCGTGSQESCNCDPSAGPRPLFVQPKVINGYPLSQPHQQKPKGAVRGTTVQPALPPGAPEPPATFLGQTKANQKAAYELRRPNWYYRQNENVARKAVITREGNQKLNNQRVAKCKKCQKWYPLSCMQVDHTVPWDTIADKLREHSEALDKATALKKQRPRVGALDSSGRYVYTGKQGWYPTIWATVAYYHDIPNLQLLCAGCNNAKSAQAPQEFHTPLRQGLKSGAVVESPRGGFYTDTSPTVRRGGGEMMGRLTSVTANELKEASKLANSNLLG